MRRTFVVVVLLVAIGCERTGGEDSSSICQAVENPTLLEGIGADEASAVATDGQLAENEDPAFYVSDDAGATWITNSDPFSDSSGLTFPVNDAARAASNLGSEVADDAPALEEFGGDEPDAQASRDCAAAQ